MNNRRNIHKLLIFIFLIVPFLFFFPENTKADYTISSLSPLHWSSVNLGFISYAPIVDKNGFIYVPSDGGVMKINPSGNKEQWANNIRSQNTPTIDNEGNLYFGGGNCIAYVFKVNPDGSKAWEYYLREGNVPCGWYSATMPVTLSNDQKTLYVSVNYKASSVYAFNIDGSLKWKNNLNYNEPTYSSPTVSPDGTIFVGTKDGFLFAINETGTTKWVRKVAAGITIYIHTPVVDFDGNVYVASRYTGNDLVASYTSTGTKRWSYEIASATIEKNITYKNGTVYLVEKNNLHAVNATSGNLKWKWTSPENKNLASPVVDKNNVVYTAGGDKVYAIDSDGTLKETLTLSSYITNLVIGGDGLIYVTQTQTGTKNSFLHAIGTYTPPKTIYPVIFIPGIGGSEFKAGQDIFWSAPDGHGGTFSRAYSTDELVWVNQNEAVKLGNDDYFDVLRLKEDGDTPEAPGINLTGNVTPFGYGDIESFFTELGYEKNKNFFIYTYDWRKDIRKTKQDLEALIEDVKQKSGQPQVNIVAHSMGGLVARNYISASESASKVNKLITLGIPHLGAVTSLKSLVYGFAIGRPFGPITIGVSGSEVRDIALNLLSFYQLVPSKKYFEFYNNSTQQLVSPYYDHSDIDKNKKTGVLNFNQLRSVFEYFKNNVFLFDIATEYRESADKFLDQPNGIKLFNIVGSNQPTLGQIKETWYITWPINLIPRREEIFINGDDTVPLYSASLKSDHLDLSAGAKIYYVEQKHNDLVRKTGPAMQTVKAILSEGDLPVEVKSDKYTLEGMQISLDDAEIDLYDDENNHTGLDENGELENNIPETYYSSIENSKTVFIKKKAKKVKTKITKKESNSKNKLSLKIRKYSEDKIKKTAIYTNIITPQDDKIEFNLDPQAETFPTITTEDKTYTPSAETDENLSNDSNPPATKIEISGTKDSSGNYTGPVTVTITSTNQESGVLGIEYSLDNGQTIQTYTSPFTISNAGETTLQVKSIDKLGNEEIPQTVAIKITTPTNNTTPVGESFTTDLVNLTNPTITSDSTTQSLSQENELVVDYIQEFFEEESRQPQVLGVEKARGEEPKIETKRPFFNTELIKVVASVVAGSLVLALGATLIKPTPK